MPDFWVAGSNTNGTRNTSTDTRLSPGPTRVEYPIEPLGQRIPMPNGTTVAQVPVSDPRMRKWVWEGLRLGDVRHDALWAALEPLRSRHRYQNGLNPRVWLRDMESQQFRTIVSAGSTVTSTYAWIQALVVEVSRKQEKGTRSSKVIFETVTLGFIVVDPLYNDVG